MAAKKDSPPSNLVVIGASAGGIEAISAVLGSLPPDFAAPIVIAQHVDPTRASHLAEILGRRSKLPVRTVVGHQALERGTVYVVPADRHVQISDHAVELSRDSTGRPKPSIDLLLSSAAAVFSERLTAVILTGTGSDGTAGARDVKRAGGTVVIQNPETARFPGMPESLAPTTVDLVADLPDIGPLLHSLVSGTFQPQPGSSNGDLQDFLRHLRDRQGIDFSHYKEPTIQRRLQRRIVATGSSSLSAYREYLDENPAEYDRLVSSFLIKVTEFFRDPALFTYLRTQVLPVIVEEAERHDNAIRIWSSGCATGEEAYSLAILLSEVVDGRTDRFNIRIFATDRDSEAIAFARRGRYGAASVGRLPNGLKDRYFSQSNGIFEVKKNVRSLVVFGEHDVAQRAPFPHVDMVVCRNMLIYFTAELQRRTLNLFAFSLRPGGYLVLGKSESARPVSAFFDVEEPRLKVLRRTTQGGVPLGDETFTGSFPAARAMMLGRGTRMPLDRLRTERDSARASVESLGQVLHHLPVGLAVIDRRYTIQSIGIEALSLLGIASLAVGEDLLHMTRTLPEGVLRQMIDQAFRSGEPSPPEIVSARDMAGGTRRYLQLSCHPQDKDASGVATSVLVVVNDVSDLGLQRDDAQGSVARLEAERARQQVEIERLTEANRVLQEGNREMVKQLADLRLANEEYAVSNEEYQSAMEEVETLNEEVQASNEELETMNEELQATVEELHTTNADLEARGVELQDVAAAREHHLQAAEAARERLEVVLSHIADAVLVVDARGRRVLANPAYEAMFGADSDFMAEGEDGKPLPAAERPQRRAARGDSFRTEFTLTTSDGTRRWFEAAAEPVEATGAEQGARGVLVIRDISDRSVRRLQDEFLGVASHELRTPLTAIKGHLQLLLRNVDDPERVRYSGGQAVEAAGRLQRLVDELVEPTRFEGDKLQLRRQRANLVTFVGAIVEAMQPLAHGQTVRVLAEVEEVFVRIDPGRMEQVLQNVLTNAFKYAPGTDYIDVGVGVSHGRAEVRVRDYGPGISAQEQAQLFGRFYQARRGRGAAQGGLGLGLYIAYRLVGAHGGDLTVTSAPGKGATFTVSLPVDRARTRR